MPNEKSASIIRFGYWPISKKLEFSGGMIEPIEGLSELIAEVNRTMYSKNDLMYPPVHKMQESKDGKTWIEVPNSEHAAETYHWHATHTLEFKGPIVYPINNFKENPTFYILQCLGYIEGVRCMPEDWLFFGKLPLKNVSNTLFKNKGQALEICFQTWNTIPNYSRLHLTNILQFYNSIIGFKWFWERFSHEYSIFDACWRLRYPLNVVNGKTVGGHKNRIKAMLDDLQIQYEEDLIRDIVETRNQLIHELSWHGENFVTEGKSEQLRYVFDLRRMNHRIIGRLLGMSGPYFTSPFTSIGRTYVDQIN